MKAAARLCLSRTSSAAQRWRAVAPFPDPTIRLWPLDLPSPTIDVGVSLRCRRCCHSLSVRRLTQPKEIERSPRQSPLSPCISRRRHGVESRVSRWSAPASNDSSRAAGACTKPSRAANQVESQVEPSRTPCSPNHLSLLPSTLGHGNYLSFLEGIRELTLEFSGFTAGLIGDNSPLLGWIRWTWTRSRNLATFQVRDFLLLDLGPRQEMLCSLRTIIYVMSCSVDEYRWPDVLCIVDPGYELCRGGTKGLEISWVDCVYAVERCYKLNTTVVPNMDVMHKIDYLWFSIDCGVTISFIYGVEYLTGMVSFRIPRLICVSFEITRLICASFEITRLICVSFRVTRLICVSFGITRLICVSFGITRLMCVSFGITKLICASFGITRLICASFGIMGLMWREVAEFVNKCLVCRQVKAPRQKPAGLLQPLSVPELIWVVVDRLTKSAHFIPGKSTYTASKWAQLYMSEIVRLHGLPVSIVSDRDARFTSKFLKGLQAAMGTRLDFSTTFHPQTDGQTERLNQVLEDMLRAFFRLPLTWHHKVEVCYQDPGYELCRGGTKGLEISWVDCVYAVERCYKLNTTVVPNMDVMHRIDYLVPYRHGVLQDSSTDMCILRDHETDMCIFGITRLICVSFGITRPICVSFGITRLICASFGITGLMCAFYGTTRLFM
ncbi:pol protein [Cucumis melo var. makuwa]|uniref:Pol protein n=1 Tax=Cucumis melo var. makuwa TaxID=1194695 RepID=A0A5A7TK01_CUCMM|nr:pol protein [Cucumis melo var. makuwa]